MSSSSGLTQPTLCRVLDAVAIVTVIGLANLVRFKCGLRWWNSMEEIENPVALLVVELARLCRAAFLRQPGEMFGFGLGYSVICGVATTYWMLSKVVI